MSSPTQNLHIKKNLRTCGGDCNIAASDLDGEFTMMINESYQDKNVIPEFINTAKELGVEIREVDSYKYYRADK